MRYRLREVDGTTDATILDKLDRKILPKDAPTSTLVGWWWIVFLGDKPVAYAGLRQSPEVPTAGYLCRAGVLKAHRGHRLQRRLIRVRERKARALGFTSMVTDTVSTNPSSSNSLIAAGYRLFLPRPPWFAPGRGLCWRKPL